MYKLSNKNNQVSIEPDSRVWNALEKLKKLTIVGLIL
jgi:hypothetical protein